jgi:hypothetical protein
MSTSTRGLDAGTASTSSRRQRLCFFKYGMLRSTVQVVLR